MNWFTQLFDWWDDEEESENPEQATVYLARHFRIRLTDPDRNLLPNGRCRIVGEPTIYEFDDEGEVQLPIQGWNQSMIDVEWEPYEAKDNDDSERFFWQSTFRIDLNSQDEEACRQRLTHLGFNGSELKDQVHAYEAFLNRPLSGELSTIKEDLVCWHDAKNSDSTAMGSDAANTDAHELVRRIYEAFNDSGFLGLGGTDEEEVIKVLTIARDQGMTREVIDLYSAEHPDELGLEAELEDELSGDDLRTAQELVRQGLNN